MYACMFLSENVRESDSAFFPKKKERERTKSAECVCCLYAWGDDGDDELEGTGRQETQRERADISDCSLMRQCGAAGDDDDVCSVAAVAAHQISLLLLFRFASFSLSLSFSPFDFSGARVREWCVCARCRTYFLCSSSSRWFSSCVPQLVDLRESMEGARVRGGGREKRREKPLRRMRREKCSIACLTDGVREKERISDVCNCREQCYRYRLLCLHVYVCMPRGTTGSASSSAAGGRRPGGPSDRPSESERMTAKSFVCGKR